MDRSATFDEVAHTAIHSTIRGEAFLFVIDVVLTGPTDTVFVRPLDRSTTGSRAERTSSLEVASDVLNDQSSVS